MTRPRAAVDCGTNSCRLLVVDADGQIVDRESQVTRLGRGIDRRGRLNDDALARTIDAICGYRNRWRELGVDDGAVRIAATSAIRDASDRYRFFDLVRDVTGVEAEVLSGSEEGRTAFTGVIGGLTGLTHPTAVCDIGGGSTELTLGDADGNFVAGHSENIGAVRLTERHLADDPPTAAQLDAARATVTTALDDLDEVVGVAGGDLRRAKTLVGVAGTVTTIAALEVELAEYDPAALHGMRMNADVVHRWADRLAKMTIAERRARPEVQEGREDVIAAGALVLATVIDRYGFEELVVSESDILDGLVATIG